MESQFAITHIVNDREISSRIYLQLCDLQFAITLGIGEEKTVILFNKVIEVMKKIESVKYHKDNLLRIVQEELGKRQNMSALNICVERDLTTGVERELEAFILQGKSCLDVLVKILHPVLGIRLHSYGDSGEKIINALSKNLPDTEKLRAEPLIREINKHREWISKWLKTDRDTIAHYRAVVSSGFIKQPCAINTESNHIPPILEDGTPCCDLVCILYSNLLTLCEDFIPLLLSIKFPPFISIYTIPEEQQDKEYPRKFGVQKDRTSDDSF